MYAKDPAHLMFVNCPRRRHETENNPAWISSTKVKGSVYPNPQADKRASTTERHPSPKISTPACYQTNPHQVKHAVPKPHEQSTHGFADRHPAGFLTDMKTCWFCLDGFYTVLYIKGHLSHPTAAPDHRCLIASASRLSSLEARDRRDIGALILRSHSGTRDLYS